MVLGLSGVVSIVSGLATGKSMETLELTEFPNMPFLYWLAVAGAVVKPKWTDQKKWPALKVSMTTPTPIDPKRLKTFKALAAWPDSSSSSSVPMMFLMAESFKLVMQVLTLPSFPVSVLGTVVNKRATYSYLRKVDAAESLTYSCTLNPAVRETFSGHAEFDLMLEAVSESKGDVVWQAVLSLVLMNPKKGKGGKKEGGAAPAKPAEEVAGEEFDTWVLPENTGRAYAALDGDISPMHLYKATAMLMGFPSPVANVHLLAARTEASVAAKKAAAGEPSAPFSLALEFKKPTLLPNRLALSGGGAFAKDAAAGGYKLRIDDKKGKPIAAGTVSSKATLTRF
ncbi:hypothetical protein OEZ85_012505 [Tetradesmus obliquus]|uniref:MaoC-like domain-containing protein n=1 Tax=Tetradesmus obliquus TaxID=3088 RepID=A0ABY8TU03_TETOB|nr:hypothetical protein OEZ85_012505 [Tetradesmus obliquus]